MQKADLFEYLAAFVTIVLAIAITDIIQSAHRLLRAREQIKWDPLTPIFTISIFLAVLSEFFGLWADARFDRLTFYGLVGFMATPTVIALAAFAVLPDEVPDSGLDLRQFYFDNRRYIIILLSLAAVGDVIRTLRWASMHDALDSPQFWWMFGPAVAANVVIFGAIYLSKRWIVQLLALVALLGLGHFAWSAWYIEPLAATP